jgi:coenzyme F420-reducing hydrogenase alpha subunit
VGRAFRSEAGGILRGLVADAQNQKQIERDLFGIVSANLTLPDDELRWRCEQTIRNYDPCISCATHCLRVTVVRE